MKIVSSMKKRFLALLILMMLSFSISGCSPWWQKFKEDPVMQIQTVVSVSQNIINYATTVFNTAKMLLPPEKLATYQAKFDHAVKLANHSIAVVQSGLVIAAESKQDMPDFGKILDELKKAIADVQAIVIEIKGGGQPVTSGSGAYGVVAADPDIQELNFQIETLNRMH